MTASKSVSKTKLFATDRLKKSRELKSYTQQEVVDIISLQSDENISFSTYSKIEQGIMAMSAQLALELARLLRVDVKEIVERK